MAPLILTGGKTLHYTPEELTVLARTLTQKQWDVLFPPIPSTEGEPLDATGYTGE